MCVCVCEGGEGREDVCVRVEGGGWRVEGWVGPSSHQMTND